MNKRALIAVGFALAAIPLTLHAQGGCVDSPESSTAILAIVGAVGIFLPSARTRYKARKKIGAHASSVKVTEGTNEE